VSPARRRGWNDQPIANLPEPNLAKSIKGGQRMYIGGGVIALIIIILLLILIF
jgi:hypothetical protein